MSALQPSRLILQSQGFQSYLKVSREVVRFSRFLKPPISNIIHTKDCDSYYMKCTRNRINVRTMVDSLVTIFNNKTTVMAEKRNVRVSIRDSDSELESQPGP